MKSLSSATLGDLARGVRRSAYDRTQLQVGMAHIGLGAFARCHLADYTEDVLERAFGAWGVLGINLRPPPLESTLGRQDGLYARRLRSDDVPDDHRVIGCIRATIDAELDFGRALGAVADPRIGVVTITVTEKGYCHIPATGELDGANADIAHDLARPHAPRSLPGFLLAAVERRREREGAPLTLISCDNIPNNGAVLRGVVLALARRRGADLARWIEDNVAFPSTMVDRIVPATTASDIDEVSAGIGVRDEGCVVGEPYRKWVIEDRFAGPKPPWDLAGAEFVSDVSGHERVKMRVLNGAQSTFCTLGALIGLDFTFEDARHPVLAAFVRRMLEDETAPTLPVVPGMEAAPYIDLSLARLRNTSVRHTNHQIATDGSQKIVQRLLNPMRDRIGQGGSFDRLACAVAGFMVYLAKASPALGAAWAPSDPFAGTLRAIADETGPDAARLARRILAIPAIFGTDLPSHPAVAPAIERHVAGLLSPTPLDHLRALAEAPEPSALQSTRQT